MGRLRRRPWGRLPPSATGIGSLAGRGRWPHGRRAKRGPLGSYGGPRGRVAQLPGAPGSWIPRAHDQTQTLPRRDPAERRRPPRRPRHRLGDPGVDLPGRQPAQGQPDRDHADAARPRRPAGAGQPDLEHGGARADLDPPAQGLQRHRPGGLRGRRPGRRTTRSSGPRTTYGIAIDFTIDGPAPLWATGSGAPRGTTGYFRGAWQPSAKEFGYFVRAVGTRYSGSYKPRGSSTALPRVNFWSIWNEPNYGYDIAPQGIGSNQSIPNSPHVYRNLLDAAWSVAAGAPVTAPGPTGSCSAR